MEIKGIRITKKHIEIEGRKFVLNKFDPFFGSYMAFKVFSQGTESGLENLISKLIGETPEEMEKLQKRVLTYCSEVLPIGEVPVINSEGNFAVPDVTAPMMMSLFFQSVMFSMTDFFESGALQDLMETQQPRVEEAPRD